MNEEQNSELNSPQTIEAKIDELGQELLAQGFSLIDRMRKKKKTEEEKTELAEAMHSQEAMMKQFKVLQSVYTALVKMNRIDGSGKRKKTEEFDRAVLEKIKNQKSALGGIVRKIV